MSDKNLNRVSMLMTGAKIGIRLKYASIIAATMVMNMAGNNVIVMVALVVYQSQRLSHGSHMADRR